METNIISTSCLREDDAIVKSGRRFRGRARMKRSWFYERWLCHDDGSSASSQAARNISFLIQLVYAVAHTTHIYYYYYYCYYYGEQYIALCGGGTGFIFSQRRVLF